LRAEVARQKMSQTKLAEATGISQSQLSKYLAGKRAPNIDELAAICQALRRGYMDVNAEAEREMVKSMKGITDEQRRALMEEIERNRPGDAEGEGKSSTA
jgi:transcriptional regulator with XRE-family HTH domain